LNETVLIIFSISRRLENFAAHLANLAAHPLRITGLEASKGKKANGLDRTSELLLTTAGPNYVNILILIKWGIFTIALF
jgi:hypothetical protein